MTAEEKAEGDRIMQGILDKTSPPVEADAFSAFLFRNVVVHTIEAVAVAKIWQAYASIPSLERSANLVFDAMKESESTAGGDGEATYIYWKLSRRAYVDTLSHKFFTIGEMDDILVPSADWDICVPMAKRVLADRLEPKILKALGMAEIACYKMRASGVTGNAIIDDEKHWPFTK